ncbi:hypothetical protein D3C86_1722120 [compost metagenome]
MRNVGDLEVSKDRLPVTVCQFADRCSALPHYQRVTDLDNIDIFTDDIEYPGILIERGQIRREYKTGAFFSQKLAHCCNSILVIRS